MSWQLFCSIVDQIPNLSRAVLHGVGEPMLVKNLPRMVRYLKDRGTYVLFNTNGTVLNEKNGRALIEAGLDELRVSFDAANAKSYKAIRGKNYFNRILRNVRAFREMQEREGHAQAASVGVAHGLARNRRAIAGIRSCCSGSWRQGSLSAATGVLRGKCHRQGTGGSGAVRAVVPRGGKPHRSRRPTSPLLSACLQRLRRRLGAGDEFQAQRRLAPHGHCAAGRGPSCTSPRMAALCRAASRRFRSAATSITRSAMLPSRPCAKSGKVRHIKHSGAGSVGKAANDVRELRLTLEPLEREDGG